MNLTGLLLDASSPCQFVGIIQGQNVLHWRTFSSDHELMVEIDCAMSELHMEPADLDFVGVGVGPGSYTGLRIAQATAEGVSMSCGIPIVPLHPLMAYQEQEPFIVIADARISGVYLWQPGLENPTACSLHELTAKIDPQTTRILTSSKKKLSARIDWPLIERNPAPHLLAEQAIQGQGKPIELLYLRKTEAELARLEPRAHEPR